MYSAMIFSVESERSRLIKSASADIFSRNLKKNISFVLYNTKEIPASVYIAREREG